MTLKEGHQKFWRMKIENFFLKIFHGSSLKNVYGIVGKSETEGNASLPSEWMDAPETETREHCTRVVIAYI